MKLMKLIHPPQSRRSHGSVLLVVMGTVVVLGIALAAVLSLTTHESRILARTMAWNAALPVAEAGVEEAMSHLDQVDGGPRGVNGWQGSGSSFVLNRNLTHGQYVVGISSNTQPVILSIGQVWCPSANRYIERRIQVTTMGKGRFHKGLMARGHIKMSGLFSSDSFDSADPDGSTDGQYDPAKRKDNGDIGTNLSTPGAINITGAVKIYGQVSTGPEGTVTTGDQISVGTAEWIDGGNSGIQDGRYSKDVNVSFPAATAPYTTGATPVGGVVGGVVDGITYKYVLLDGNYQLSTLRLTSSDQMLVMGNASLLVDKDVSLAGQSSIVIQTNSSLQLYVQKGTLSVAANGIINQSGNATNLTVYGLPGLTTVNMGGNSAFIGTIYAPHANLKLSGSGSDRLDFTGAGIFNEISGVGNFNFHYDESLGYNDASNLIITSWKEL